MMARLSFWPVARVTEALGATSSVLTMPCGVSS